VASVQLLRVLLAVAVVDCGSAEARAQRRRADSGKSRSPKGRSGARLRADRWAEHKGDLKNLAVAPVGDRGGLIGIATSLPAGGIIGALVCSAAFRLLRRGPCRSERFRSACRP
jgi:hypothetical protein